MITSNLISGSLKCLIKQERFLLTSLYYLLCFCFSGLTALLLLSASDNDEVIAEASLDFFEGFLEFIDLPDGFKKLNPIVLVSGCLLRKLPTTQQRKIIF